MSKAVEVMRPIDLVRKQMTAMEDKFGSALAGAVPSTRFVQVAMNAIAMNPAVLEADRQTLYTACMKAASDGLILDGREAALTTFNTKQADGSYKKIVTYMPMVRGLVKLMLASESVQKVDAHVVFENDEFEHTMGLDETINHKAPKLGADRGKPIGVYAIARLVGGMSQIVVMDSKQIDAVKACAKDQKVWSGPFWDQQWEKTALRRLSKRVEMGGRLESAMAHHDEAFDMNKSTPEPDMAFGNDPAPVKADARSKTAEKILGKNQVQGQDKQPVSKPADKAQAGKEDTIIDGEFKEVGDPGAEFDGPI
jgi:recombination protein RecT